MRKENKIDTHAQKREIESIILSCKFSGQGSTVIAQQIKNKIGLSVSRPTIDKYYKEKMNGDTLALLMNSFKEAIENNESPQKKPPAYELDTAQSVKETLKQANDGSYHLYTPSTEITNILERSTAELCGLIDGNIKAHIKGSEKLKIEYIKYLKELQSLKHINRALTKSNID